MKVQMIAMCATLAFLVSGCGILGGGNSNQNNTSSLNLAVSDNGTPSSNAVTIVPSQSLSFIGPDVTNQLGFIEALVSYNGYQDLAAGNFSAWRKFESDTMLNISAPKGH